MEQVWGVANVDVSEWSLDGKAMVAVTGIPSEPAAQRPMLIDTSSEALEIYRNFYDKTANEMLAWEGDNLRGTFEKLRTYAARLALVIHITRTVEQELFLTENIDPNVAPWDKAEQRINELECDAISMQIALKLNNNNNNNYLKCLLRLRQPGTALCQRENDINRALIQDLLEQKREYLNGLNHTTHCGIAEVGVLWSCHLI